MSTRRALTPAPERPELDALIERARSHVMTPAEIYAQRRSWVIGEMMLEHPDWSREETERLVDEVLAKQGYRP